MNRRNKTLLIVAGIAITASSLVGRLAINPWNLFTGTAFSFVLFAEVIFFIGLYALDFAAEKTEQIFSRSGIITILSTYALVSIGISIYYVLHLPFKVSRLWALQIIAFAVAAILAVVTVSAGKRIYESDYKKMATVSLLQDYVSRLNVIALDEKAKNYCEVINKLAEKLKLTDTSRKVDTDDEISDCISSLELLFSKDALDENRIDDECKRLNSLIKKRKLEVSYVQRGKF